MAGGTPAVSSACSARQNLAGGRSAAASQMPGGHRADMSADAVCALVAHDCCIKGARSLERILNDMDKGNSFPLRHT